LYVADTGNRRVLILDVTSGVEGDTFGGLEPVETRTEVLDAELGELVGAETLESPSGLELHAGLVFLSDNATSKFYAFDKDGEQIRTLETGLPAGSLGGFTFGPDGKLYFVDILGGRVLRIDPKIDAED
jgi:sugar lactone lactonase YvrE